VLRFGSRLEISRGTAGETVGIARRNVQLVQRPRAVEQRLIDGWLERLQRLQEFRDDVPLGLLAERRVCRLGPLFPGLLGGKARPLTVVVTQRVSCMLKVRLGLSKPVLGTSAHGPQNS